VALDNAEDTVKLQRAIDVAAKWSEKWKMPFNVNKCKVMHIGKNNPRAEYQMDGHRLATTEMERDVGVQITPSMKWSEHCGKAAATATRVLAQIARAFSYRDRSTFMRLYKSYVRPHLEFASPAWSPWLVRDMDALEKVQKKAVGMVGGLKGATYEEKLVELGLQSLSERRREADLLLIQKVMHGTCRVNGEKWKNARNNGGPLTRAAADPTRLDQPRARLEIRSNYYTVRIPREWNELPQDLRETQSAARFKANLRRHTRAHAPGERQQRRANT